MRSILVLNYFIIFILLNIINSVISIKEDNILVLTVATEEADGYLRYLKSAKFHNIIPKTVGLGTEWLGGDMQSLGGGYKVNLIREVIKPYKSDKDKIILFTDSYDVVFLAPLSELIRKFIEADARILFGAEHFCWPDKSMADKYPKVNARAARYLNSGAFIGYASDIYEMLKTPIKNTDDDQLYYTKAYLNAEFREKHNMKLDTKSEVFLNLNGATASVKLEIDIESKTSYLINTDFETKPAIVHGNGPSKINLNSLSNYLIDSFQDNICLTCSPNKIKLIENKLPIVTMGVFIEQPMPFFEEFLDKILSLNYPKENIHLFFHCNVEYHEKLVEEFISRYGKEYKTYKEIKFADSINEADARNLAVKQAILKESDYLFVIDSDAHLDMPDVLRLLLVENRNFIAPMLTRPESVWSNFWGALSENGFYARSNDYMDIVNNVVRGIWNVPYISSCYLIRKTVLHKISYKFEALDPDMAFCYNLRKENIFMNILNYAYYGHLLDGENFNINLERPDFYMMISNKADWEERYIHPEYIQNLDPEHKPLQPCPDVFWFPIGTDRFCDDLVAIMENFGKWSDGSNSDKRLEGGYEAVPTRDIHMNQVGLERLWLTFLKDYIRPLQEKTFIGYYHDPPHSLMNFVVRYRPDEQPSLRPHHDSSTYTINIALNRKDIDYEGGGCHFLRYNCSVEATKKGWLLMHPGRLTHFHEGLRVTKGTRYIMISFVDP